MRAQRRLSRSKTTAARLAIDLYGQRARVENGRVLLEKEPADARPSTHDAGVLWQGEPKWQERVSHYWTDGVNHLGWAWVPSQPWGTMPQNRTVRKSEGPSEATWNDHVYVVSFRPSEMTYKEISVADSIRLMSSRDSDSFRLIVAEQDGKARIVGIVDGK
jgi:hypothetical protein